MWQALFADLDKGTPKAVMAARFHLGLADAVTGLARHLIKEHQLSQVVLSGGVFQNRVLFEAVARGLRHHAEVLSHRQVPANDGGLSFGQWAIAAATALDARGD